MYAPYDNRTKVRSWKEFLAMCEAMREVDQDIQARLAERQPYVRHKTREQLKHDYSLSA
jgi:hypothetical protein